jgi:hypothetical protein
LSKSEIRTANFGDGTECPLALQCFGLGVGCASQTQRKNLKGVCSSCEKHSAVLLDIRGKSVCLPSCLAKSNETDACCLHWTPIGLIGSLEDGGIIFLRNCGVCLWVHMVSQPRTSTLTS